MKLTLSICALTMVTAFCAVSVSKENIQNASSIEPKDLAEESQVAKVETYEALKFFELGFLHLPAVNFKDRPGEVESSSLKAAALVPLWMNEQAIFAIQTTYSLYALKWTSDGNEREVYLHSIGLPITFAMSKSNFEVFANVTPSLDTDFEEVTIRDYQLGGTAMLGYWFHAKFKAAIGVAVTNEFGKYPVVPLVGVGWYPARLFDLTMVLPSEAAATFHFWSTRRRVVDVGLFARFVGGRFNTEREIQGRSKSVDVSLSFLTTGIGVSFYPAKWMRLGMEGGVFGGSTIGLTQLTSEQETTKESLYLLVEAAVGSF